MGAMKKSSSWLAVALGLGAALAVALPPVQAASPTLKLEPCRLRGVEHDALCGVLQRPLDPAAPQGKTIDVHVTVLPALARNKKPDPVFLLAGGPGQSAIGLAATAEALFARLLNRRDVVLVDQRGVGRSAPLACDDEPPSAPLAGRLDNDGVSRFVTACREALQKLPHGDLRQYTTTIAMQDIDAVRAALGAERVNVIGGSYGTRAALEYARQFPQRVRRLVLDGVAPPDMVLPATFSSDGQAALDAVFAACEADAGCRTRHPQLRERWRAFAATLPRPMALTHPLTGALETVTVTRDLLASQVRLPLYAPAFAAALPAAMERAMRSDLGPLLAMSLGMSARRETQLAIGMHFSVVCAEDLPRLAQANEAPGADFGTQFADLYARVCADWPRGTVPPEFYRVPALPAAALVLSGGADPVTPPRHGERITQALGPSARHVVVAQAGHGVMALPCVRDVLFRFVDADTDAAAQQVDAGCAAKLPRPPAFVPLAPAAAATPGAKP
jgi:pimeloyl-ACP methyl ester carboxylesterase